MMLLESLQFDAERLGNVLIQKSPKGASCSHAHLTSSKHALPNAKAAGRSMPQ